MRGQGRAKPKQLAQKLRRLRKELDLSQTEMLVQMGFADELQYTIISKNETGMREPTLPELLAYAKLANVYIDVFVDDSLDLPTRLPSPEKSAGVKRKKK